MAPLPAHLDMSPKMRDAITILALEETSQAEAARRAGVSPSHLSQVIQTPAAQALLSSLRDITESRLAILTRQAHAAALEAAIDILKTSKSEAARIKLVELFTRQAQKAGSPSPAPTVAVQVVQNSQPIDKTGYSYIRPGQSDIKHLSTDDASD